MTYWQIASGSLGRDYTNDFIRFGMAFVGGSKQKKQMGKVVVGDRILLKRGMSKVVAVGEVVERDGVYKGSADKEWLRDYDGWDLQEYCIVDWHRPDKPWNAKGLTRNTIQRVFKQHLKELADEIISSAPVHQNLDPEPQGTDTVEDIEIIEHLIKQGLRPGAAEDLAATFNRIRLLARYYYDQYDWQNVREHETRTFLVIPLLLALGWAEQQIKIELPVKKVGRADIACFSRPFARKNEECVLIVETKGFSQGLDYARKQAKGYTVQFPKCRTIIVSNGYCYKTWIRQDDGVWADKPTAYLNLLKPRKRYPLDPVNVAGCLEVLSALLPNSQAFTQ